MAHSSSQQSGFRQALNSRKIQHNPNGYFSLALVKGGYGVVVMKSNVKLWKVKFLFITTLPAEFLTQPRVVQLSPKFLIKDVLDAEESLRDMFSTKTLMAPKWESIISSSTLEKYGIATVPYPYELQPVDTKEEDLKQGKRKKEPELGLQNASAMLLAVWHDRFKEEAHSDEAAQEEDFDSAGSWKWKHRGFRDEIEWLIRVLPSSR
ncbi:hypothetical protein Dimus_000949 [Dionaea muscipula]